LTMAVRASAFGPRDSRVVAWLIRAGALVGSVVWGILGCLLFFVFDAHRVAASISDGTFLPPGVAEVTTFAMWSLSALAFPALWLGRVGGAPAVRSVQRIALLALAVSATFLGWMEVSFALTGPDKHFQGAITNALAFGLPLFGSLALYLRDRSLSRAARQ
jgi:hypothetical protein